MRFSPRNCCCPVPSNQSGSILTIRDSAFWSNHTVKIWVLICIRRDQSGTRSRDFCAYKPASLRLWRAFSPLKTAFPWLNWNTEDVSPEQSRIDQNRLAQNGAGKAKGSGPKHRGADKGSAKQLSKQSSAVEPRGAWPWGCLPALPFDSCTLSQLSYFTLESSFLLHRTSNWGLLLALNWHWWPFFDTIFG